ncbi:MAG: hypothetical protein AAF687_04355 [Pseudomonadota bacterium]
MAKRMMLSATALSAAMMMGGVSVPVSAAPSAQSLVAMQSFPRLPKVPKVPKVKLPGTSGDSSAEQSSPRPSQSSRELEYEYRKELGMLAYPINTNWSSKADNVRIEKAVAEYLERVERVASGRFDSLSAAQRKGPDDGLRAEYDTLAKTADRSIAWAEQKIGKIGVADSAYNDMLVLDAALHGAVTLYPDVAEYQVAKQKSAAVLGKFGSRAGANEAKEELALAEARKVRMPASIDRSSASVRQFRQAWATGGIPGTIKKIHVTSGWGTKRNSLGVIIGRTRDAAIAVQDPATGRCNLYDFTMIIEPGGSPRRSSHSTKRIACENIPS